MLTPGNSGASDDFSKTSLTLPTKGRFSSSVTMRPCVTLNRSRLALPMNLITSA